MIALRVLAVLAFSQVAVGLFYANPDDIDWEAHAKYYQDMYNQQTAQPEAVLEVELMEPSEQYGFNVDWESLQKVLDTAKSGISPVFDGGYEEILEVIEDLELNRQEAYEQINDSFDDCSNAVYDIAQNLGVADSECVQYVEMDFQEKARRMQQEAFDCINNAKLFGEEHIANALNDLDNDRQVAEEQVQWGCDQLVMCGYSQYTQCNEEICKLDEMKTQYVKQVNENIKKATYAQEAEAAAVGTCIVANQQCTAALYDEIRAAVEQCAC